MKENQSSVEWYWKTKKSIMYINEDATTQMHIFHVFLFCFLHVHIGDSKQQGQQQQQWQQRQQQQNSNTMESLLNVPVDFLFFFLVFFCFTHFVSHDYVIVEIS